VNGLCTLDRAGVVVEEGMPRPWIALGFAWALACGPSAPAPTTPNVVAKNITPSEGVAVTSACTPTGPELCFNATDDNCNGIIDEGCGSQTGVLQFMIAWGDSGADVDLVVVDPNGSRVHKGNRSSSSGLQLERNCPEDGCHGQNTENVFFDGNEPPRGKYVVEVKLVDPKGADLPVKVHLSARVGSRTYAMDLALSPTPGQDRLGFSFEL
jgi:tRNA (guanosine-2'-O-)-methyltransferase